MAGTRPRTPLFGFALGMVLSLGLGMLLIFVLFYPPRNGAGNPQPPTPTRSAQDLPVPTIYPTIDPSIPRPIQTAGAAQNSATRETFETAEAVAGQTNVASWEAQQTATVLALEALATPTCPPAWQQIALPNLEALGNTTLNGIAAVSSEDIWAVGYSGNAWDSRTLTLHWDGKQWNVIPSPNNETGYSLFTAVAAISSNDVWAVGNWHDASTAYTGHTLAAHWDGAQWSIISTPDIQGVNSISAIATDDVWAAGTDMMHWDGATWSIIPRPEVKTSIEGVKGTIGGVTALSPLGVWAVGQHAASYHIDALDAIYWNGTQWKSQEIPTMYLGSDIRARLVGIVALSHSDVWAVGGFIYGGADSGVRIPIIMHRTDAWKEVPIPDLDLPFATLRAIDAASPNDIWAVGSNAGGTVTLHWDGKAWKVVASANAAGCNCGDLNGVAVVAPGDVWAVGSYSQDGVSHTLIEHLDHPVSPSPDANGCLR